MSEHIVIFGASGGALKIAQALIALGFNIEFLVDNDERKQGKSLEGIPIKKPFSIIDSPVHYKIVIASVYHREIEEQLLRMGVQKDDIILGEELIMDYINSNMEFMIKDKTYSPIMETGMNVLVELAEGVVLGGIEKWCISLAQGFYERNYNVALLTNKTKDGEVVLSNSYYHFMDLSFPRYREAITELVDEIISQLPCVIIVSKINQVFMAAYIVKKYYREQIKVISVLHNDFVRIYKQNCFLSQYIDAFMCVSKDIKERFVEEYQIDGNKVFFTDSPISYDEVYIKQYSHRTQPIQIGYGGRLEKGQKRTDLIIPLINKLEEYGIDYVLNIAGGGRYFDIIKSYVSQESLEDKVKLYGVLPFEEMVDFWKKCDIFINVSDFEGSCLSMLEAMSLGAVPVVTDTSGVNRFIQNGTNGYITDLGDMSAIAESIRILSKDREKLKAFGDISREAIKNKCNMDNYIEFLLEIAKK